MTELAFRAVIARVNVDSLTTVSLQVMRRAFAIGRASIVRLVNEIDGGGVVFVD